MGADSNYPPENRRTIDRKIERVESVEKFVNGVQQAVC
jgi:hypothetical protein